MNNPAAAPIRVMVVDDHPMMREGISAALIAQGGIEIVCTSANGSEAIADFARHRPDVSLVDLQMPVKDGLEAIIGIRALHPMAHDASATLVTSTLARIRRDIPRWGKRRSNRKTRLGPTSSISSGLR